MCLLAAHVTNLHLWLPQYVVFTPQLRFPGTKSDMCDDGEHTDIVCRKATHEDYDDVMNINRNLYGGLDYLPAMYHHYIDDPARYCYVLIYHRKLVTIYPLWHNKLQHNW